MIATNLETGQVYHFDNAERRVGRLRQRLRAWWEAIQSLKDFQQLHFLFVTLTYRDGQEFRVGQISDFIRMCEDELKSHLVGYAWVAEMQQRGVVHYHVLFACRGYSRLPKPDERDEFGRIFWPWGMSQIKLAVRNERVVGYLIKYISKGEDGKPPFPSGIRIYAVSVRGGKKSPLVRYLLGLYSLPAWLRERLRERGLFGVGGELPTRMSGGCWLTIGGILERSPWAVACRETCTFHSRERTNEFDLESTDGT